MKKTITYIFIVFLISCQPYRIDYDKFTINEVVLKQPPSKDSLLLKVDYTIPPKSFGKKAIMVCFPMVIDGSDTTKFTVYSYMGEKYMDGTSISYNIGVTPVFISEQRIDKPFSDSAIFRLQCIQYKGEKEPTVLFEKLVSEMF